MFAASSWWSESFGIVLLTIGYWMWVAKKIAANNPDAANAAKKAAAGKAIGFIARLFK
jgi:uncharacterized membrane protein YfcA